MEPWFADPEGELHHLSEMRRFAESLSPDFGPLFGRDVVRLIDQYEATLEYRMRVLDQLDDLMILCEIRRRDAADTGERISLDTLIREQGFDPDEIRSDQDHHD